MDNKYNVYKLPREEHIALLMQSGYCSQSAKRIVEWRMNWLRHTF